HSSCKIPATAAPFQACTPRRDRPGPNARWPAGRTPGAGWRALLTHLHTMLLHVESIKRQLLERKLNGLVVLQVRPRQLELAQLLLNATNPAAQLRNLLVLL